MHKKETDTVTLPTAECHGIKDLPTPVEKEYLDAMRKIKMRVRDLKDHRNLLRRGGKATPSKAEDLDTMSGIDTELSLLKDEWVVLEKKWEAAVKDRMIRLGHEE